MKEVIDALISYCRQGGPWMIGLFLCSVWAWAVFAASVFPLIWNRSRMGFLNSSEQLERASHTLMVLAMVAPLLGLLGTVSGMISAFKVLSSWGVVNPRSLASAISEALITTQTGLTVAVPAIIGAHILEYGCERTVRKR